MNRLVLMCALCVPSLAYGQDVLAKLDQERTAAGKLQSELNTALPSLLSAVERSRKKLLDLDDRINALLQEDSRRDTARLNWQRISALLDELETATCEVETKSLEYAGWYDESDIVASGHTAGECLQWATASKEGYEGLSINMQPWFLKSIEVTGKIATLENYIE